MTTDTRGAVLQFEISRKWWDQMSRINYGGSRSAIQELYSLASSAACDVIRNKGTLVIVVSDEKITIVQRPDAADIEPIPASQRGT